MRGAFKPVNGEAAQCNWHQVTNLSLIETDHRLGYSARANSRRYRICAFEAYISRPKSRPWSRVRPSHIMGTRRAAHAVAPKQVWPNPEPP